MPPLKKLSVDAKLFTFIIHREQREHTIGDPTRDSSSQRITPTPPPDAIDMAGSYVLYVLLERAEAEAASTTAAQLEDMT